MEENSGAGRCPPRNFKSPRVIVVAVAQNNRLCRGQVHAQDTCVILEDRTGPRVKENTPGRRFQPEGEAMFAQDSGKSCRVFNQCRYAYRPLHSISSSTRVLQSSVFQRGTCVAPISGLLRSCFSNHGESLLQVLNQFIRWLYPDRKTDRVGTDTEGGSPFRR